MSCCVTSIWRYDTVKIFQSLCNGNLSVKASGLTSTKFNYLREDGVRARRTTNNVFALRTFLSQKVACTSLPPHLTNPDPQPTPDGPQALSKIPSRTDNPEKRRLHLQALVIPTLTPLHFHWVMSFLGASAPEEKCSAP